MKIILTLVFLSALSCLPAFARSTAFSIEPDSIPAQQRYHVKLASNVSPNQTQWATVSFYPSKSRSGNEIRLPLGFNQTTVRVSSGDRVLQVDEDYVFIPNANLIRVLDEDALTSQQPTRVTYEGVPHTVYEGIRLGYRP